MTIGRKVVTVGFWNTNVYNYIIWYKVLVTTNYKNLT